MLQDNRIIYAYVVNLLRTYDDINVNDTVVIIYTNVILTIITVCEKVQTLSRIFSLYPHAVCHTNANIDFYLINIRGNEKCNINGTRVVGNCANLVRALELATGTYRGAYINIAVVLLASCFHLQIISAAACESYADKPRTRIPRYLFLAICDDGEKK